MKRKKEGKGEGRKEGKKERTKEGKGEMGKRKEERKNETQAGNPGAQIFCRPRHSGAYLVDVYEYFLQDYDASFRSVTPAPCDAVF
jgi:hypothetical protein